MNKQITALLLITTTIGLQGMENTIQPTTSFTREQCINQYYHSILKKQKNNQSGTDFRKNSTRPHTIDLPTGTTQLPSLFIVTKASL